MLFAGASHTLDGGSRAGAGRRRALLAGRKLGLLEALKGHGMLWMLGWLGMLGLLGVLGLLRAAGQGRVFGQLGVLGKLGGHFLAGREE